MVPICIFATTLLSGELQNSAVRGTHFSGVIGDQTMRVNIGQGAKKGPGLYLFVVCLKLVSFERWPQTALGS